MAQKDSQEKLLQFRFIEARLEGMIKQRDLVANRIAEIESTLAGLGEISKANGDVVFHVGGEAFVPAKPIQDGKLVVMIGADVAVEKTVPEAKTLLESRMKEAQSAMGQIEREIDSLTKSLEQMVPEIEAMHGH